MRWMSMIAGFLVLILPLTTHAQPNPPWCTPQGTYVPSDYRPTPKPPTTIIQGITDHRCINSTIYVFSGKTPDGELLGYSTVESDGTFTIHLSRPMRYDETILVYADCPDWCVWEVFKWTAPPIIPEPATLLLVGSGLVALGLKVLRSRHR
ncbi:MAG: PEP-CTERM sorting domain-containing protein [Chloroflexi bacterium]|nr:PEP-CTERM sorting domain-containing protein [Chloroflexota bacterium]